MIWLAQLVKFDGDIILTTIFCKKLLTSANHHKLSFRDV